MKAPLSEIKVIGHKFYKKGGRKCQPNDFVTLRWKTWMMDGTKVEDSQTWRHG
jgi:hypothetical protein